MSLGNLRTPASRHTLAAPFPSKLLAFPQPRLCRPKTILGQLAPTLRGKVAPTLRGKVGTAWTATSLLEEREASRPRWRRAPPWRQSVRIGQASHLGPPSGVRQGRGKSWRSRPEPPTLRRDAPPTPSTGPQQYTRVPPRFFRRGGPGANVGGTSGGISHAPP